MVDHPKAILYLVLLLLFVLYVRTRAFNYPEHELES